MVWLTWAASYIFHALAWKLFFSSLPVLLTSWFVTNHWLWVGWLLVFVANFIDCSSLLFMSVSMFSLWNASSYELYLDPKITAIALFWSLSMLVMFFLGCEAYSFAYWCLYLPNGRPFNTVYSFILDWTSFAFNFHWTPLMGI